MADKQKNDPGVWFIMLIVIAAIFVSDSTKHYLRANAAVGAGACTIVMLGVAKVRWDLKGKWWFWAALCAGAALQLPLIFLMPWSDRYLTGIGAMAFVIPGFLMALGCVVVAERIFATTSSPKQQQHP